LALLINGLAVNVPGVTVLSPRQQPWCYLTEGKDCTSRVLQPHMWILHKTIADDPERVLPGAGPPGGAQKTATYWQQCDGKALPLNHSGAHLVTGDDGVVACLCDLATVEAYHATVSNPYSVGHETREEVGGLVYSAALGATVETALVGCETLGIQLQVPKLGSYDGHPIKRMLNGGVDCVGIFGHRDNTEARGRWDPGDVLFQMLVARGAEQFDFAAGEDLDVWGQRQRDLNAQLGTKLAEDGIPGHMTVAALKLAGYASGIWVLGKS
jgi:N-acetylmuramoyl-L-alanine amidase